VLRLRFVEGLSVKECQEAMGVSSPGTISEQERRGIERLREMAKRDGLR
jgi:DNA-directed RNA polymerase specialized sigma24 family protein